MILIDETQEHPFEFMQRGAFELCHYGKSLYLSYFICVYPRISNNFGAMKVIIISFIFAHLTKTGRSQCVSLVVLESACTGLRFTDPVLFSPGLVCCYDECADIILETQCTQMDPDECDWKDGIGCFTKTNSPTLSPSKSPTNSPTLSPSKRPTNSTTSTVETSSDDDDTDMDTLLWCLAGTGLFVALLIVLNIGCKPDDGDGGIANELILV